LWRAAAAFFLVAPGILLLFAQISCVPFQILGKHFLSMNNAQTTQEPGKSPRRIHVSGASRNGGGGNTDRAGVLSYRRTRRKEHDTKRNTKRTATAHRFCFPILDAKNNSNAQCGFHGLAAKPQSDFETAQTTPTMERHTAQESMGF
jgi:hypothetical protein